MAPGNLPWGPTNSTATGQGQVQRLGPLAVLRVSQDDGAWSSWLANVATPAKQAHVVWVELMPRKMFSLSLHTQRTDPLIFVKRI